MIFTKSLQTNCKYLHYNFINKILFEPSHRCQYLQRDIYTTLTSVFVIMTSVGEKMTTTCITLGDNNNKTLLFCPKIILISISLVYWGLHQSSNVRQWYTFSYGECLSFCLIFCVQSMQSFLFSNDFHCFSSLFCNRNNTMVSNEIKKQAKQYNTVPNYNRKLVDIILHIQTTCYTHKASTRNKLT